MPDRPAALDHEHLRIVTLVARGWTDRRIAREVGLSPSTVWRRVRAVADALGVRSRAELVARAVALGLVETSAAEENSPRPGEGGERPARELDRMKLKTTEPPDHTPDRRTR